MRIKKVSQTTPTQAQVVDGYSTSEFDSYSCNYTNNTFEPKGKILWTNPNPTVSFPAQTVTLNESLDNYDMYEILVLQSTTNARLMSTGKIPVGHGTIISYNTSSYLFRPTGVVVSGSTISFEDGKGVAGGTVSVDNGVIMPMYVIGYKTGLFS